ncbi:MAG: serine/threonine protein phosphatase, partial [Sedimenticola sp.]
FVGHKEALAVFEKTWLAQDIKPEIDLEQIKIPPEKKYFFSVNWRHRYVFEFLLPPADLLLERRLKRSRKGTHHVDVKLELKTIEEQIQVYRQAALHLHLNGLNVYLREEIESAPLHIINTEY